MPDNYGGINRPYGDTPHTLDHPATSLNVADDNATLSTGNLRRKYNFGKSYTKLSFQRDPFIHILNTYRRKPTDDPKWKYTMKRKTTVFKRFGYVVGCSGVGEKVTGDVTITSASSAWGTTPYLAFLASTIEGNANMFATNSVPTTLNQECAIALMGDYAAAKGNKVNVIDAYGSTKTYTLGDLYTKPKHFLTNQIIRINTAAAIATDANGGTLAGYVLARITGVYDLSIYATGTTTVIGEGKILNVKMIRVDSTNKYPVSYGCTTTWSQTDALLFNVYHGVGSNSLAQRLEPARSYVAGNAHHELSGYGQTYRPQPFSTEYGYNQIFKETAMMSNRARATVLKFEANPWAEEWEDKFLEMTYDIAQAGYFGDQYEDDDGITYTQGWVDWALDNANRFGLTLSTKTVDDFLDDYSAFNDPRHKPRLGSSIAYFCRTDVWNWLHQMGGFQKNSAEISPNYRMQWSGEGKLAGVDYSTFKVSGGTMNVVRDIHLDGTVVKIAAIDMNRAFIRPLIGNGINRDVTVYVGVKTIENSGEDYRVDLIQGDIGFEFDAPELHAIWL